MSSETSSERQRIHKKVTGWISDLISTGTAFMLIFSVLLTLSNWPAYSLVIQDWIDPTVLAQRINVPTDSEDYQKQIDELQSQINPEFLEAKSDEFFDLADLGDLYPNEMRLEIPKLIEGTIPVREVEEKDFDFDNYYDSENKIQEALRTGVVHYPYTANPNQYGNVFITGHSSYYPWDDGEYKEIFALLHKLEVGDLYYIYYKGDKFTYQVIEKFEIQPDDISVLEQPVDKRISTLMTCTPIGTVLRRLIIRAELISSSGL